jgi:hypothetical protein
VYELIKLEAFTATELDEIFVIITPLTMEAEMVSETLGFCPQLTRLVAREDFIVYELINLSDVSVCRWSGVCDTAPHLCF